jgi:hypothetical protein
MDLVKNRAALYAFGRVLPCSCKVRNELTPGGRSDVVHSENADGTTGVPYMPRPFPSGLWTVGRPAVIFPEKDVHLYMWPFFIPTDAHQLVDVWEVSQEEVLHYIKPTGQQVMDWGYGMHFSSSLTTLGCEKILIESDLRWLVDQINGVHAQGNVVQVNAE